MYLKRLDIQGFKSFTENTPLLFDKGITSIVGPNGCGKSNIIDAIRWVLGEQSMKTIRGSRLEDVIFTGTEYRKPLGFAEVSLTLDNQDKVLDVDFLEVSIKRRYFRSGESEFFLNKTSCRLKDINTLFLDTGVGRDGYSIIGQGRIDEVLSTRSEDRRHIFEEASGIMKFKVRKEEGIKKLELTKQNLLRINDILHELELQLEPLKKQAEIAKSYLMLRDHLKELEISVYIDSIDRFRERIKKHGEEYKISLDNKNNYTYILEKSSKSRNEKSDRLKILEKELETSQKDFYALEGSYEKSTNEINLNKEKINSLEQNLNRICNEISSLEERQRSISETISTNNIRLEELREKHKVILNTLSIKEKEREDLVSLLDEAERHMEEMKTRHMNKLDLLADKRVQIANIKTHIENIRKRNIGIVQEKNILSLDVEKENTKKALTLKSVQSLEDDINKDTVSLEDFINLKRELGKKYLTRNEKKDSLKSIMQMKTSRYNTLQEMERNFEGYNKTVKVFLQSCNRMPSLAKGIRGVLGQLISVDKKYETAIEMALGGIVQNIVTEAEEDAKIAIEFLKKKKLGRATFLPMNLIKGRYADERLLNQIRDMQGFLGIGSDLLRYDKDYKGIILNFLGQTLVVENLDTGLAISKKCGFSLRVVTLEGDILATSGAITGGSKSSYGYGLIGRSREIGTLKYEIEDIEKELTSIESDLYVISHELKQTNEKIQITQSSLKEKEMEKLRYESQTAHFDENIKNMTAKTEMLAQEYKQNLRQEEDSSIELNKYIIEQEAIESEINRLKEAIEKYQNAQRNTLSARDEILDEITNYRIQSNSCEENSVNIKKDIQDLNQEKKEVLNSILSKKKEETKAKNEAILLTDENLKLEIYMKNLQDERTGKNIEILRIVEERKIIEEELEEVNSVIENTRENISLLNEELTRLDIRKAKVESELDAVQNKLWDEYELTYSNALEYKKDFGSITRAQNEINEYKSQIKELGYINVNAIEEYSKTKERFDFISAQKIDMEDSVEKLKKVIYEINTQMKQQFVERFELINNNFNKVFVELFGGGRANLRLTNKENILESGIEIDVQPPGKRLQNMMLLSGGERAFTAIALLFSILLLKPVSFCVLDEIEASLDESNVARFASYIKKLSRKTQFIVTTHKKATMEVSDIIYGVTMQEKGVSKVVSLKMKEGA